jgi:hypothetical protein
VDDLNAQAAAWCAGVTADRPCPEQQTTMVREAFAEEAPRLLKLPDTVERVPGRQGRQDALCPLRPQHYSVPRTQVGTSGSRAAYLAAVRGWPRADARPPIMTCPDRAAPRYPFRSIWQGPQSGGQPH